MLLKSWHVSVTQHQLQWEFYNGQYIRKINSVEVFMIQGSHSAGYEELLSSGI
jgi:hypothetical protein